MRRCRGGGGRFGRILRRLVVDASWAKIQDHAFINGHFHFILVLDQGLHAFRPAAPGRRLAFVAPMSVASRQKGTKFLALDTPRGPRLFLDSADQLAGLLRTAHVAAAASATIRFADGIRGRGRTAAQYESGQ